MYAIRSYYAEDTLHSGLCRSSATNCNHPICRGAIMSLPTTPPTTLRARTVYFIWSNIPRFALLIMVALIVVLFFAIKKEGESIAASKAAAISAEKPAVNAVTLLLTPREIRDRINLPGSIEPWTDLQLLAKIKGTVTELLVSDRITSYNVCYTKLLRFPLLSRHHRKG